MTNKKLASAVLTSLIITSLAGTPVLAAPVTTTSTSTTSASTVRLSFNDVSSDYWGIRHISKLALEGVIQGVADGIYDPEKAVSQQDVLIMATRMMGLQSEVDSLTSETVFPDFMLVDKYARNYVAVALQKGLISTADEKLRSSGAPKGEIWGQKKATREWVAEVVIRAIGKASMASNLAGSASSFTDKNQISTATLGFVNAAVALKIVDGFEDGSFQPRGAVTRAQMATFLSRSQKNLTTLPDRAVKGYMTSLTSGSIAIMDGNGNTSTYKLSPNTKFFGTADDKAISSKDLQETYEVSLVQVNGTAYYVEILNDELHMDVHEGQLLKLNLTTMKVTLDDFESYDLASDVSVTDVDGRGLSLGDIIKGSTIQIRKSQLVESDKYTSIVVKQIPVNKTSVGEIQALDKNAMQLSMLEASSGEVETFGFSSNVIATLADTTLITVDSIHIGDTLEYTVKNSEIVKIVVKKQADVGTTVEGSFKQLSDDKSTILINKTSGKTVDAYELSNNTRVVISGLANASIYDLTVGDQLKLDVLNNKVTKITVTNRSIENVSFAKIIDYSDSSKILTVTDSEGNPNAYKLNDDLTINYAGTILPFSSFNGIFTRGKFVDIQVSNKNVKQIQLSSQLDGALTQLNVQTNDVTIKTSSGQSLTFKLNSNTTVELANKPGSTFADLKVGDNISLILSFDQSTITKIVTSQTAVFKTILLNPNLKQVTVLDSANKTFSVALDGVPIVKGDGSTGTIADFAIEDYVKLSFKGLAVTQAEVITPVRGKVTAVNAASGSLTVQDFTGKSQVVNAGSKYDVTLNGGTSWSFSSIKVGDRVQVMKGAADGTMHIQVAIASKREVDSYSSSLGQFYVKAAGAGDQTTYNVFSRVYAHKGTTVVSPSAFVSGEQVTIYVLDNKIVEIEK
ncbi:S-layer homology domain-containing protein [Paenibacillus roseipurpureus]|uniref:S-layer homology domain-containing protein n=1 Tax=Paenibacillus roseopurpureus TaxID=2918901 RepID=A0AA96RIL0_9BACL|nr:S-layer homology domain-containing protein [Paenibacillus sp. MBLB1832]WNR42364.1 S-layer homology domain-containing protein [Paenibacillus sp. MBLB1832]